MHDTSMTTYIQNNLNAGDHMYHFIICTFLLLSGSITGSPFTPILLQELAPLLQGLSEYEQLQAIDSLEKAFHLEDITEETVYKTKLAEYKLCLSKEDNLEQKKLLALTIWPLYFNTIIKGSLLDRGYIFFEVKDAIPVQNKGGAETFVRLLSKIEVEKKKPGSLQDPGLIERSIKTAQELAPAALGNYKIHLMPKQWSNIIDQTLWIHKLAMLLQKNNALRTLVPIIKIILKTGESKDSRDNILPLIVIYPGTGKSHAQEALNILYAELKCQKGSGLVPRFNQKVTDLIYFAQSDADIKETVYGEPFFTKDKVYLDAKKVSNALGINVEKFELTLPLTEFCKKIGNDD